ncbi:hypothetical protein [Brochothrix thermosphacta]|uniref:hypothetical protein n=1 Tax=Brochothrix thermosphacta TaxID=2756 RepID=UPI001C4F547C|nr:hypothetical protein [Brochothrix thermosphacta]
MFKQIFLYDGSVLLLESITKYKLENGEIVDEAPAPIAVEKEVEVVSEETDEITRETIIVYEGVQYEEIEIFDYPEEYTEIKPEDGLYQPIFFDGKKWNGSKKEDWEAANPPEESEGDSTDDNQEVLEELILQVAALTNNAKGDE